MKEEIIEKLSALPGKIGFYYKNLVSGEGISYHADERMMAASVIKLFILAEAEKEIAEGRLDKDKLISVSREKCVPSCGALTYLHDGINVTVEDLYTLMIILSDNTATNYMIDILGFEAVNDFIGELGYKTVQLNRKMFDAEKSALGIQNYISAEEVGDLLERMYRGELICPAASADMLRILRNQRLNHKISFFLKSQTEEIDIAHKTGEDDGISHDAGIVFAREPFVVVFCGNETDVPLWERTMADISLMLYEKAK